MQKWWEQTVSPTAHTASTHLLLPQLLPQCVRLTCNCSRVLSRARSLEPRCGHAFTGSCLCTPCLHIGRYASTAELLRWA